MAGQIQRDDAVVLLEEGHLLTPRRFVTGPAMDEDDCFRSAAAYGRLNDDAVYGGGRCQHGEGQREDRHYRAHEPHYIAPGVPAPTPSRVGLWPASGVFS